MENEMNIIIVLKT